MSDIQSLNNTVLKLTDRAVTRLIAMQNNPTQKLRVHILGGGCSGFQYKFCLDENQGSDDLIMQGKLGEKSVAVLVDTKSFQYLKGATLDFIENLQGAKFVIMDNPNAEGSCGCGASFTLKGETTECGTKKGTES